MASHTDFETSENELAYVRNRLFNLQPNISNLDHHSAQMRSRKVVKVCKRQQLRPSNKASTEICMNSEHPKETHRSSNFGSKNGFAIPAGCLPQEDSLETGFACQDASPYDYPNLKNHYSECVQIDEKKDAPQAINLIPRIDHTHCFNASTKDCCKFHEPPKLEPAALSGQSLACENPLNFDETLTKTIGEENEKSFPTMSNREDKTINLDNLFSFTDETATKIAYSILESFNLANFLLQAFERRGITNVMDVLEHSVVKIMISIAKKYLEINRSMLKKTIKKTASPIALVSVKPELVTSEVIVNEVDLPFNSFDTSHKSLGNCSNDVSQSHNYPCKQLNSSVNGLIYSPMNESEFDTCQNPRPTASTPKSSRLNVDRISSPVGIDPIFPCDHSRVTVSPSICHIAGEEQNKTLNNMVINKPKFTSTPWLRDSVKNKRDCRTIFTTKSGHQKYGTVPVEKMAPVTQQFEEKHNKFPEWSKMPNDTNERSIDCNGPSLLAPYYGGIDPVQKGHRENSCHNFKPSSAPFSAYDNYEIGITNPPFSYNPFQAHHFHPRDHLLPNPHTDYTFASLDKVEYDNCGANGYSSNFPLRYRSTLQSPYPSNSQHPNAYYPMTKNLPTFQTLPDNFVEPLQSTFQSQINGPQFVVNSPINPTFQKNQVLTSNENFNPNPQYPLEHCENYFCGDKCMEPQDVLFRAMGCQAPNSNRLPEDKSPHCENFRQPGPFPYMNHWNKRSLRSSISVIRGCDGESDAHLEYSGETNLSYARQSEPLVPETMEPIYSPCRIEYSRDDCQEQSTRYSHGSFSADSLNLSSERCNSSFTENETVNSSKLSCTWFSSNETTDECSFSAEDSYCRPETPVRKKINGILKPTRFPLLCEFNNRYDSVNFNPIEQEKNSMCLPFSSTEILSRLSTSSILHELQGKCLANQTETNINETECAFNYLQSLCVNTNSQSKCEDSFSTDDCDIDSSCSVAYRKSVENYLVYSEKGSVQEINGGSNSSVVSQLARTNSNLDFDAEPLGVYERDYYKESASRLPNETLLKTKLENTLMDYETYPEHNKSSVACQTDYSSFLHGRENMTSDDSENGSSQTECSIEHCSCTYTSNTCDCISVTDRNGVCNCRDPQITPKCSKNVTRHNFGNKACVNCNYLTFLLKPRHSPLCSELSRSSHTRSSTFCENFKACSYTSCKSLEQCCGNSFNYSKNLHFIQNCCATDKFSTERAVKSKFCTGNCSCSENFCSCDEVKSVTFQNEKNYRLDSNDKMKVSKSLFTEKQTCEEASIMNENCKDISHTNCLNFVNEFITSSLPDYCEIKRKLYLCATANQTSKLTNVALNYSDEVCACENSEEAIQSSCSSETLTNYNIIAEEDTPFVATSSAMFSDYSGKNECIDMRFPTCSSEMKLESSKFCSEYVDSLEDSKVSEMEVIGGYSSNTMDQRSRVVRGHINKFHPTMPLITSYSPTPVASSLNVTRDAAGTANFDANVRAVSINNRSRVVRDFMKARKKALNTKCKEPFRAACIEKNTVKKLVAIFEALSREDL